MYHEQRQQFIIEINRKFDKNVQKIIFKNNLNDSQVQLKAFQIVFKCCLVVWTIAETLDNCFNNFRHFVIYPNFSIFFFFLLLLLLLLLFLFEWAMVKLRGSVSIKTIDRSLKYQYPLWWALKSTIFLCDYKVWAKTTSFWMPLIVKP